MHQETLIYSINKKKPYKTPSKRIVGLLYIDLAFNTGRCNTFYIIFLHEDEHDDHWDCRDYQCCHDCTVMYRLCSEEGLNCKLNRTLVFTGHNQEWPHKVIPVSNEIKDKYSCIYSLGNWHNNLEESSCRTTSINCSRLDQIIWNITEKLTEHIDGETFCYKRNYQCYKCIYPAKL